MIHSLYLGRIPYADALALQQELVELRHQGRIQNTLLLLEHPPVLTLGRSANRSNIVASDIALARAGVTIHEINRGGDVTYHGPGQLVGYPIVDLRGSWPNKRGPFLGPVDFVRLLEEALIRACADFGVLAKRIPKCTGVWTFGGSDTAQSKPVTKAVSFRPEALSERSESKGRSGETCSSNPTTDLSFRPEAVPTQDLSFRPEAVPTQDLSFRPEALSERSESKGRSGETCISTPRVPHSSRSDEWGSTTARPPQKLERKLAAIGVHVSQGVTSHGFALNVTTDLRDFNWIIPCGIRDRGVTSLELEADTRLPVTMANAINSTARAFGHTFQRQILHLDSLETLLTPAATP